MFKIKIIEDKRSLMGREDLDGLFVMCGGDLFEIEYSVSESLYYFHYVLRNISDYKTQKSDRTNKTPYTPQEVLDHSIYKNRLFERYFLLLKDAKSKSYQINIQAITDILRNQISKQIKIKL